MDREVQLEACARVSLQGDSSPASGRRISHTQRERSRMLRLLVVGATAVVAIPQNEDWRDAADATIAAGGGGGGLLGATGQFSLPPCLPASLPLSLRISLSLRVSA